MKAPERRQISSWQAAELNARDWMRAWGFRDAELTPPGADSGLDIRARGAVAQVKYEARDVGRPYLQLLVGARGRDVASKMFFFTGSRYTEQAIRYADEMSIALFHYELDGRMEPANKPAEDLLTDARKAARKSVTPKKVTPKKVTPVRVTHPYINATGCWIFCLSLLLFIFQFLFPAIQGAVAVAAVAGALFGLVLVGLSQEPVPESEKQEAKTNQVPITPGQRHLLEEDSGESGSGPYDNGDLRL